MDVDLDPDTLTASSSVVHLNYDIEDPPELPPPGWTRFVCISDTHSHTFPVPPGDVLLHSGDLTGYGRLEHFQVTMDWLCDLPHPVKLVIAGNHDLPLHEGWYGEEYRRWHREPVDRVDVIALLCGPRAQSAGVIYLQDEKYQFQTKEGGRIWTVYGSPWSPYFFDWAFNYSRNDDAEALINAIPPVNILMTHGPPHTILDRAQEKTPVGCEALLARLPAIRPALHVFGHIHEARGAVIRAYPPDGRLVDNTPAPLAPGDAPHSQTVFVNAANAPAGSRARYFDGRKKPFGSYGFQPIIVDLLDSAIV